MVSVESRDSVNAGFELTDNAPAVIEDQVHGAGLGIDEDFGFTH